MLRKSLLRKEWSKTSILLTASKVHWVLTSGNMFSTAQPARLSEQTKKELLISRENAAMVLEGWNVHWCWACRVRPSCVSSQSCRVGDLFCPYYLSHWLSSLPFLWLWTHFFLFFFPSSEKQTSLRFKAPWQKLAFLVLAAFCGLLGSNLWTAGCRNITAY